VRARRLSRVLCAVAVLTAAGAVTGPVSGSGASTAAAPPSGGAIQHVIVIMQSGHSFDNYFGIRPKVNGIPAKACQPIAVNSTSCVKPFHLSSDQARAALSDNQVVTKKAFDSGKMDGFVSAQSNTAISSLAMGYLNGADLPYYWSLASRFTLFDRFFASSQAGALPNRLVSVAAQDAGQTSNEVSVPINVPTIFDRLDQAHLGWKYYVQPSQSQPHAPTTGEQSRTPLLTMPSFTSPAPDAAHIVSTSQYFDDLTKGQLPAVSYITSSIDSERSPQNPAQGEAFVRSLINSLMQSSAWKSTALLLTYDDSGGWYDHAVPPTIGQQNQLGQTTAVGLRVPTILVSPYARAGQVDSTQLDTASIPAMIESVFHLAPLTQLDASSNSILTGLNMHQQAITPSISPSSATAVVVPRPAVQTIYLLYVAALLGAGLLVVLAFMRSRRHDLDALSHWTSDGLP
jgi:phospholipase C